MSYHGTYIQAPRHPWPCFLFLLPLLFAYEGGVLWLGGTQPEMLRNGADTWFRKALEWCGMEELYWAPMLLAAGLLVWSWLCWRDKPDDLFGVWLGMAIESVAFALGLWGVSRALGPVLEHFGITLNYSPHVQRAVGQIVTYVGAGIYEETLFRLILFAGLCRLLRYMFGLLVAVILAAAASALLFSAAHHVGPFGDPFDGYVFLFRTIAGVYFAVLMETRGFGIAVGAHACYDVLVGASVG